MTWYSTLYKYKNYISLLMGTLVLVGLLHLAGYPQLNKHSAFLFFAMYFFQIAVTHVIIYLICSKKFKEYQEFYSETMFLVSDIVIKIKNNTKVACFTFENKTSKIKFEVETAKGFLDQHFEELNIDTIMIKKKKDYTVHIVQLTRELEGQVIDKTLIPVSIEYYDLEDKFYLFKITSTRKEERG